MLFMKSFLLFALSCATLADAHLSHSKAPKIKWVDCAQNVPESTVPAGSFNASIIDLKSLPSTLHCGRLDVPMDYSKPMCEGNTITLGVAMYKPKKSKGPLFFNPGGTDAGVIVAWEVALNITNAFSGLMDFDLIVMDVRGTFSSNPLNVSLELFAGLSGPYPTNQTEWDAVQAASAAVIQSWIDNSSPPGIIQHVGTREVIQDYNSIRKALGYQKINFLAASYGSYRVTQYAATFPEQVGRFVQDAVVPHGRNLYDQAQDTITAGNRIMLRADAYCQNDPSCPFKSQGKGSVLKVFHQILEMAEKSPFCLSPCTNDTSNNNYIYPLDIRNGLENALFVTPDFPAIFECFNATLSGDASCFASGPPNVEGVVGMPLLCNDNDYVRDFATFNKSLTDALKNDITGIGLTQAWEIQIFCSGWKFPVSTPVAPLHLNEKMLLVTSDFDYSAPTEWATFVWDTAPNSILVDRHGDSHVSFNLIDQPSTKITKDFLNSGNLPAAQNSTLVTVYTPGMVRGPIPDPYLVPTGAIAGDVNNGAVIKIPFKRNRFRGVEALA